MESAYHEIEHDDMAVQQAARDAIMDIPAFPELQARLTRVFGPSAERDMVHQLVYWFRKPKMQNRWWAYKTAEEWRDERGLNRKQVNKARARLKPRGVLEEKYGNYKRLHYRLDWVKLAELLSIPLKGGQSYEWDDLEDDDFFDEPFEPLKGGQSFWSDTPKGGSIVSDTPQMDDAPDTYAENYSKGGGQTNAREYAGEYLQNNTLLQRAAEPALAEPAAPEINKEEEQKQVEDQPVGDKRHSQDRDTQQETAAATATLAPPIPDDDALLAEVREVLNPESGRWWGARFVANNREHYRPEKLAKYLADDEDLPYEGRVANLVPVVRYVFWEASRQEAAA